MINDALKALQKAIKNSFPSLNILLNWPGPDTRMKYPALIIVQGSNRLQSYTPLHLQTIDVKNKAVGVWNVGEYELNASLHFLTANLNTQSKFQDQMASFFNGALSNETSISTNRTFYFGEETYTGFTASLESWRLDQEPFSIKSGERRSIFNLLLDIPRLVYTEITTIKEIKLDAEIGEKVKIN